MSEFVAVCVASRAVCFSDFVYSTHCHIPYKIAYSTAGKLLILFSISLYSFLQVYSKLQFQYSIHLPAIDLNYPYISG